MPSFASEIKREICNVPIKAPCCSVAELAGVICYAGIVKNDKLYIKTEASFVAKRIYRLARICLDVKGEVIKSGNTRKTYKIELADASNIAEVMRKLKITENGLEDNSLEKFCCKKAFLRGAFLASGSCNDPKKSYHLEITSNSENKAEYLRKLLEQMGINAGVLTRRNNNVVYIKDSDGISDIVGYIGATSSMMEIQRVKIYKVFKNNITRTINLESANINKYSNAAADQRRIIKKIQEHIGLDSLESSLRELAILRLENECPLKELGAMMSKPLSKSGVNHKIKKLYEIAQSIKE